MKSPKAQESSPRKTWKGKSIMQKDDNIMLNARDTDIVIPVMGPTGVGKSTFLNTVIGDTKIEDGNTSAPVGHGLNSHTQKIEHFAIRHPRDPERRLVFVDTPGFDDTYIDDSEILRRIAVWLAKSYSDNMKLAGVVYLHEISQPRMMGAPRRNLEMFRELCGDKAVRNVVLATTKWGDVTGEVGEKREQQLRDKYWGHMLKLESKMFRFHLEEHSAWNIVNHILNNEAVDALLIQQELVEFQKIIPETKAGRALRATLIELLASQEEVAVKLKQSSDAQGDERLRQSLEETQTKIQTIIKQIRQLKVPLTRRILLFLSFKA
ncbi:hypothetical protein D9615_001485 [Tricholomella constricta]|uniref:Septin-type G domain-containing protein n=1 Tax=Tricholomella constricta TaxID=117010 RepID=A0A8H5HK92_9AGAR|nr:hypothetical protein D9615_001485 [Tricholomella constricta]